MSPLEDLVDSLAVAEVHVGFPAERRAMAGELMEKGVTAADVDLLAAHCRSSVRDGSPPAVLASILRDDQRRDRHLVDLREIVARKAKRARQDERAPGDKPYTPAPIEGEPRERWEHDRQCMIAKCLRDGDRKSMAAVASELGVKVGTARTMVERGRVLSQPLNAPPDHPSKKSIEASDAEQEDRRRRFVEAMRARRQSTAGA